MLEKLPTGLGHAFRRARPGMAELVINDDALADVGECIVVTSPAFEHGAAMPVRVTADGAGISPPLEWHGVPGNAAACVLLVEDADSPTPHPLVHAIVCDLPGANGFVAEGELPASAHDGTHAMGRNSYLRTGYLPPDPPPGHGPHRYAFQVFALDQEPEFDGTPGRGALVDALRGHVLGKGLLVGTYERP